MSRLNWKVSTPGFKTVTMYKCRKCPGLLVAEEQREAHILQHQALETLRVADNSPQLKRASSAGPQSSQLDATVVEGEGSDWEEVDVATPESMGSSNSNKRKILMQHADYQTKKQRRQRVSLKHYVEGQMAKTRYHSG